MWYPARSSVAPPSGREVIGMTRRMIAKGRPLGAGGMLAPRTQKLSTSVAICLAASLAFTPISAHADDLQTPIQDNSTKPASAQGTLADEAPHVTPVTEGTAAPDQPTPPPSTAPGNTQGTLADEAPRITPVFEGLSVQTQPPSQDATPPAVAQGTLADEAPHITPIAPDTPGADTTEAPRE